MYVRTHKHTHTQCPYLLRLENPLLSPPHHTPTHTPAAPWNSHRPLWFLHNSYICIHAHTHTRTHTVPVPAWDPSSMWHNSFICHMVRIALMWLMYVCDMTHVCVWHDSCMCVTCMYVTWLMYVCDTTHVCVWHVCVWHDSRLDILHPPHPPTHTHIHIHLLRLEILTTRVDIFITAKDLRLGRIQRHYCTWDRVDCQRILAILWQGERGGS